MSLKNKMAHEDKKYLFICFFVYLLRYWQSFKSLWYNFNFILYVQSNYYDNTLSIFTRMRTMKVLQTFF